MGEVDSMNEEYDEIDLRELLHVVLGRWWLIVLFAVVAVLISAFVTLKWIDPVYEAKSTLFIGKESDSIAGISFSDLQIDDQLVVDYQELIKTRLVTEAVIEDLNLSISVSGFVERLSVTGIRDSRFMHIVFQDTDPQRAARISNRLSESLVENAKEIVGVENVVIVDRAITPEQPVSPRLALNLAIAGVLGLMLGLFLVFALHMLDNTFRREEDIERELGITVLGVVPRFDGDRRDER